MRLYVVLGECGEYSDRAVWVSGVYASEEEAKAAVEKAAIRNRTYNAFQRRLETELVKIMNAAGLPPYTHTTEMYLEAKRIAGPEPHDEPADRCEIKEATLGEWQCGS